MLSQIYCAGAVAYTTQENDTSERNSYEHAVKCEEDVWCGVHRVSSVCYVRAVRDSRPVDLAVARLCCCGVLVWCVCTAAKRGLSELYSMELLVANKYRIGAKINSGSFGTIYRGTNVQTGEPVAMKLEPSRSPSAQLSYEARVYKHLNSGSATAGIPRVYWYGTEGDYNVLVIDLLGPSLEELFNSCGRKFTLKTTLMAAEQLVCRVALLHTMHFLHRDIKPDNFAIGLGRKAHHIYMLDFGLSKRYRDPKTHQHIPPKDGKNLTGTARYCSLNTHVGLEQGRRDDLESVGYVLLYFLRGSLPWQGLRGDTKQIKYERIRDKKQATSFESLCGGLPPEFVTYLHYTRNLRFEDKPDYAYLKQLFRDRSVREGYEMDYAFDWAPKRATEPGSRDAAAAGVPKAPTPHTGP